MGRKLPEKLNKSTSTSTGQALVGYIYLYISHYRHYVLLICTLYYVQYVHPISIINHLKRQEVPPSATLSLPPGILVKLLWPLLTDKIPIRTGTKRNLGLSRIETIKLLIQRLRQIRNGTRRMQLLPRLATSIPITRLQHHHQRVQTRNNLANGSVRDLKVLVGLGICGEVDGLVRVCFHVEKFLLVGAPDGVVDAVGVGDEAESFVGVVLKLGACFHGGVAVVSVDAFGDGEAPVFDGGVLGLRISRVSLREGEGFTVEARAGRGVGNLEEGWGDVGVTGYDVQRCVFGNAGATDGEGNVDVGFYIISIELIQLVVSDLP